MSITLRNGKDLKEEPPKKTKKVDVELVSQEVDNKVPKNLRNYEYLKI